MGVPAFVRWPRAGETSRRLSSNPICTASYPSDVLVFTCVTQQGPACITVTGTTRPFSSNTWVIPILRPRSPLAIRVDPEADISEFDFDLDAGRNVEPHQRVDCL